MDGAVLIAIAYGPLLRRKDIVSMNSCYHRSFDTTYWT